MLFKQHILEKIAAGTVCVAFRRWKRPTVKSGGTLQTPVGLLAIESVDPYEVIRISSSDAEQAGFGSRDELLESLANGNGQLYRIRFKRKGDDPRIALRNHDKLTAKDVTELLAKLKRFDSRSPHGPWTSEVLQLIANYPEMRAAQLTAKSRHEKEWLKMNIRKLKNLGLTESLTEGYCLSPRGLALLKAMRDFTA